MREYVFFNAEPCAHFRAFLAARGVTSGMENGELVDAIVEAVESPDERSLCKRGSDPD